MKTGKPKAKIQKLKREIIQIAIKVPQLKVTDPQVIELWVRAAGRCEFHGCNDYLLKDKLTTNKAKLADIAHIVSRSKGGPRGNDPLPMLKRNQIENLLLACTKHHRLIDKKSLVIKYPKRLLLQYKQEHEERITYVTGLYNEYETTIVRLIGNIRGNTVSVSNEEIREAVLKSSKRYPRYLGGEHHIEIDLTTLSEGDIARYWADGVERIKGIIERRIIPAIQNKEIRHLSLFSFARIPFLAYLGYVIGDKCPLEIFQKHRQGDECWNWPTIQQRQRFTFKKVSDGFDKSCVAVMISLSGQIILTQLPSIISDDFTIYSLCPTGAKPSRNLLLSKESLEQFRHTYASLLREIETNYPSVKAIHMFPAVPISAAVILGRELMRNVSPSLIIYDKGSTVFEEAIRLDSNTKD